MNFFLKIGAVHNGRASDAHSHASVFIDEPMDVCNESSNNTTIDFGHITKNLCEWPLLK